MNRIRWVFILLAVLVLVPTAVLVKRVFEGLALEDSLGHRAVAERIFDEMERQLADFLRAENARTVSTKPVKRPFVVTYFGVNPDGSIDSDEQRLVSGLISRKTKPPKGDRADKKAQAPGSTRWLQDNRPQVETKDEQALSPYDAINALNQTAARQRKAKEAQKLAPSGYREQDGIFARSLGTSIEGEDAEAFAAVPEPRTELLESASRLLKQKMIQANEAFVSPYLLELEDPNHLLFMRTSIQGTERRRQGFVIRTTLLTNWLQQQVLDDSGLQSQVEARFSSQAFEGAPELGTYLFQHRFSEPFESLWVQTEIQPLPGTSNQTAVYAMAVLLLIIAPLGLLALYRMVAILVEYSERRSNFVAAVSHELKTPLTAIRMYSEMLRDDMVESDAKRQEYYRTINDESERLTRLVNNVLEFSRLERNDRDISLVAGAIGPVVQDVVEIMKPHAATEGFELQVETDADLPPVRFDRDALSQVIFNGIDNALKYAKSAENRRIVVRCRKDHDQVVLSMRDYGPGIPPQHLSKVFEPFFRSENELTRRTKGTGLGLALIKGLAERMGASVAGKNCEDGGFELRLAFTPAGA